MTYVLFKLIEILINIFQCTIAMYFAYKYLGDKKDRKFWENGGLFFSMALTIFLSVVNYITAFEDIVMVFYILFVLIYAISQLKGKLLAKLFASAYQVICNCIIGVLTANFYSVLFDKTLEEMLSMRSVARLISLISTQLIIIYIYLISIRMLKRDKESFLQKQEWLLIIIIFLMSIIEAGILNVISLQYINEDVSLMITIIVACIIFINIVTISLVANLSKKNKLSQENKELKLEQAYQQQLVDKSKEEYENIRKIRHDYKNTYNLIYTLIEENKLKEAREYIEKNLEAVEHIGKVVNTRDEIVNAIVSNKITIAKNKGIKTTFISVSDFNGLDKLDISGILGNLYDNAIEACEKCEPGNRRIDLKITENDGTYIISMKNTIRSSVIKVNPNLETTKREKEIHGLGTKIIKDYAKKYDGIVDYYEENEHFCCMIVLHT